MNHKIAVAAIALVGLAAVGAVVRERAKLHAVVAEAEKQQHAKIAAAELVYERLHNDKYASAEDMINDYYFEVIANRNENL